MLVEVAGAVHRAVVVDPPGHARRAPRRAAVEEQELLAGCAHRHACEQLREPDPARPHDGVALEPRPVTEHGGAGLGRRAPAHDARAVRGGLRGQRAHAALRPQHPGLRLVEHELQVVDAEAREELRRLAGVEPLRRDALRGHRALGLRLPAVGALGEPRHAALDQQVLAALGLQLAPQLPRSARGTGVVGLGAVRAPVQPRLAARAGARVARLELVDERDLVPRAGERPGQ